MVLDYLECQHRTPIISQPLRRSTALGFEGVYRSHTLSAEELARDVQGLAADDDNLLAAKELLGDNAGQAAKQVALAIDHNLYERVQRSAICNSSFCTLRFRYGVANLDAARLRSWSLGLEKTNRSDGDVKMVMPRTALNKVPIFRMKIKRIHTYHRLERRHFAGGELGKTGK
jgi:hypothetical protein